MQIWPDFSEHSDEAETKSSADPEIQEDMQDLVAQVLSHFGGEVNRVKKGIRVFYKLSDGKVVNIKYSKKHSDYYWFGFHASLQAEMEIAGLTHAVFILVPDAFVTLPVDVLKKYLAGAGSSPKSDGTVRHYHVLISCDTVPVLFHHGKPARISTKPYLTSFDQK